MNKDTMDLIDALRDKMVGMNAETRMEMVIQLTDGFSDFSHEGLGSILLYFYE